MRAIKAATVLCLALGLTRPAWAAEDRPPARLTATSKWRMDYADDSCALLRGYGEGNGKVVMSMEQFEPGDTFFLTLAGKPVFTADEMREMRIRFGPSEDWQSVSHYRGYGKDRIPIAFILPAVRLAATPAPEQITASEREPNRPAMTPERENRVTEFYFDTGRGPKGITMLDLGPMGAPMAALHKCMEDLVTTWGLNWDEQKRLLHPATPKTNPGEWMKSADYPTLALRDGARAIINFRLMLDANGDATSCHIQNAVGGPEFEKAVCDKVMKRASFEPALNAEGKPVPSYYICTVRFDIPNRPHKP